MTQPFQPHFVRLSSRSARFRDPRRGAALQPGAASLRVVCEECVASRHKRRSQRRSRCPKPRNTSGSSTNILRRVVFLLSGHGFSRADTSPKASAALAAEGQHFAEAIVGVSFVTGRSLSLHSISARLLGARSFSSDISSLREAPSSRGAVSASIRFQRRY